jgi:hypothetical protein
MKHWYLPASPHGITVKKMNTDIQIIHSDMNLGDKAKLNNYDYKDSSLVKNKD